MEPMKVIVSIVERGQGAALEKLYRKNYVTLHLQCAGKGTATSEIMDILGLGSSEKDVVLSCAAASAAHRLLRLLDSDLRRSVKGSGLVFSGSSQTAPLSVLPIFLPAAVVNSLKVRACA